MRNLFNIDSPLMQKLSLFGTLILMNALWLLCCIPIVTIGASTTALYRITFDLRENKGGRLVDFFRTFRDNFRQSSLIWLIDLLGAIVLFLLYGLIAYVDISDLGRVLALAVFFLLFLVWFFSLLYCFALTAYFENTLKNTLVNAFAMSFRHLRQTIVCAALTLVPLAVAFLSFKWFLILGFVWVFVYPGLAIYWKSGQISDVFANYTPDAGQPDSDSFSE